uniref:ABC transporter permease n=1 Tax=Saccharothrix mutabilis TaxID=33921 RepID=UPI0031E2D4AF
MKVLVIAGTELRRVLRDRVGLFFLFVLPFLLVLVMGATFGGSIVPKLGVVGGGAVVEELRGEPGVRVVPFASEAEVRTAVERGEVSAGLVLSGPRFLARPDAYGQQVRLAIQGVLARDAQRREVVAFVAEQTGADPATAATVVESVAVEPVTVTSSGGARTTGLFDTGAANQLLLFVFLTALTSSAALVETRRLGVSRRMIATPTTAGAVVLGEGLGRVAVAAVQGVAIVAGTWLLFGVRWGDPVAVALVVAAFALVAGAAGMLIGSVLRSEQQVGGIGVLMGLGFAALGGVMVPLELFGDTMRTVALFTPHAWAGQALSALSRGGGVPEVLLPLGVLTAYAAVLFAVGSWLLRRSLTR